MADVHNLVSLGLGTPGDITHFLLVGLSADPGGGGGGGPAEESPQFIFGLHVWVRKL